MTTETQAKPEAQFFSLEAPLLAQGRSDTTVAKTDLLRLRLKVYASGGVSITVSRKKPNYYKVTFTGISDTTRTPGQQIGMFWETTPAV